MVKCCLGVRYSLCYVTRHPPHMCYYWVLYCAHVPMGVAIVVDHALWCCPSYGSYLCHQTEVAVLSTIVLHLTFWRNRDVWVVKVCTCVSTFFSKGLLEFTGVSDKHGTTETQVSWTWAPLSDTKRDQRFVEGCQENHRNYPMQAEFVVDTRRWFLRKLHNKFLIEL